MAQIEKDTDNDTKRGITTTDQKIRTSSHELSYIKNEINTIK